jgi:hypothetical protein
MRRVHSAPSAANVAAAVSRSPCSTSSNARRSSPSSSSIAPRSLPEEEARLGADDARAGHLLARARLHTRARRGRRPISRQRRSARGQGRRPARPRRAASPPDGARAGRRSRRRPDGRGRRGARRLAASRPHPGTRAATAARRGKKRTGGPRRSPHSVYARVRPSRSRTRSSLIGPTIVAVLASAAEWQRRSHRTGDVGSSTWSGRRRTQ